MRGAEFAGERQPAGEPIDGDDRGAACDPRRHQSGEADPADPYTAIDCSAAGCITFSTAPAPVCTPQPSGASISIGASRRILTTSLAGATAKLANEDC